MSAFEDPTQPQPSLAQPIYGQAAEATRLPKTSSQGSADVRKADKVQKFMGVLMLLSLPLAIAGIILPWFSSFDATGERIRSTTLATDPTKLPLVFVVLGILGTLFFALYFVATSNLTRNQRLVTYLLSLIPGLVFVSTAIENLAISSSVSGRLDALDLSASIGPAPILTIIAGIIGTIAALILIFRAYPLSGRSQDSAPFAQNQPQYGQAQFGQPQYGQPQFAQAQPGQQFGQPTQVPGQPQYGQPQYGQPQYGQPMNGQAQPTNGQQQYGQPMYGQAQPTYGQQHGLMGLGAQPAPQTYGSQRGFMGGTYPTMPNPQGPAFEQD